MMEDFDIKFEHTIKIFFSSNLYGFLFPENLGQFLSDIANCKDFRESIKVLDKCIQKIQSFIPLKQNISLVSIANDLCKMLYNSTIEDIFIDIYSTQDKSKYVFDKAKGLPYQWLVNNFNLDQITSKDRRFEDLPLHSRIFLGFAPVTTEMTILNQALLNYYLSEHYLSSINSILESKDFYELNPIENDLCSIYMRAIFSKSIQSFISFITFLESFINSIAYNAVLTNIVDSEFSDCLLETEKDKNGRNITYSLIKKLYMYPHIIKHNAIPKIDISSKEVISILSSLHQTDLFDRLQSLIDIRNAFIHNKPLDEFDDKKPSIIGSYNYWYNNCLEAYSISCEIGKILWNYCYNKNGPNYLNNLDKDYFDSQKQTYIIDESIALIDSLKRNKKID